MHQNYFCRLCCCAGIAFLLASCATPAPIESSKETDDSRQLVLENQQALRAIDQFSVNGGLGVWTDDQSISTRIDWRQQGQDFNVLVEAPAGLASMRLTQVGGVASIQRGQQAPVEGRDAGGLLQQALGLEARIPIEEVALWIRGLPGSASDTTFDQNGRLISMVYRQNRVCVCRGVKSALRTCCISQIYVNFCTSRCEKAGLALIAIGSIGLSPLK